MEIRAVRSTGFAHSYAGLIAGRERVRVVLAPCLGEASALERANNIAQAMLFEDVEVREVAEQMLRAVPASERRVLADAVSRAWKAQQGQSEPRPQPEVEPAAHAARAC